MRRRRFLQHLPLCVTPITAHAQQQDPLFPAVPALAESHFPSRLHQFVWRNWELANLDRMALVVGGSARSLNTIGRSMGLPPKSPLTADYLERIYITVIRQNWHLLPEEQIQQLLGWDRDKFAFTLKEDDFLDVKLGRVKPACDPLRYQPPSTAQRRRAAQIARRIRQWFPTELAGPPQPRLAFVDELSRLPTRPGPIKVDLTNPSEPLRVAAERFRAWTAAYPTPADLPRLRLAVDSTLQSAYRIDCRWRIHSRSRLFGPQRHTCPLPGP